MSDWKDLDTTDIPNDYFDNPRYEVQHTSVYGEEGWFAINTKPCDRWRHIQIVNEGQMKYRYRLKPLKPIQVTKKYFEMIAMHTESTIRKENDYYIDGDQRRIEIID